MDLSSSHIFTELELETAFSSAMTDLDTQTNPIPSRVRPTDTMMSDTIHAPALIFGGDFVAEELLFETPTANTLPVTEIQSRRIFYDAPAQQPSYMVPYAGGPVTRGTTKAFKIGISPTQETKLHNIAMPSNSYTTPLPSPASSDSSPPAATQPNRRKRKLADFDDEDESSPKTKGYQARNHAPIKKTAHSLIEQRYRTNLNDKIAALRDCVPRLGVMSSAETASEVKKGKGDAAEDFQGLSPTHKLNKATVLSKAAEFILHLDKRNKALCKENIAYKNRIKAFEILMLTTKNSDATTIMTTNTAPTLATSPPSSGSSRSGNCSFDSTSKVTSLTEGRINDVGNGEDAEREANMRMSEKEEVLKYELDAATANYMPFTASRRLKTNIPKGALVLVTGATGFVGSHTSKALLDRGYKVRGAVRDLGKASWLINDVLKDYADRRDFELAYVPDLAADHAFDEAIKGVSAIVHVASILAFDPDPNKVIPRTIAGATSILDAAIKEQSVEAFVYTSSIGAVTMPIIGNDIHVKQDTYNDFVTQAAWAPPPYEPRRGVLTYMASKVAAEKAVWKFAEERKPNFTINSIAPSVIMGEALNKTHNEGDGAWIRTLYDGRTDFWESLPAHYGVGAKDVAVLHVAAILDPAIKNARLQAWGHKCNGNDILAIMRKHYPQHKFVSDLANQTVLSISADFTEPLALLKKWADQEQWKSLEQTVIDNVDSIIKLNK
ncbi:hypothetical protein F5884DRAFT_758745 [Xylogone sp. PMI_703]|nr:hypothetical protein F5884DRAFT_758745 [Xylogone sp. PMI_703]